MEKYTVWFASDLHLLEFPEKVFEQEAESRREIFRQKCAAMVYPADKT